MELKEAIEKRHCTRRFSQKDRKVRLKDAFDVMEAALHAPAAGNIPTVKLVLVEDSKLIAQIADAAPGNDFINEADKLIIVLSDPKQVKSMYGERGEKYMHQQAGAAIENMLLAVEDLNLASCWVGAFDDDAIKRVLKVPDDFSVEAILPLGHAIPKAKAEEHKRRKPTFKEAVHYNKYGKKTL